MLPDDETTKCKKLKTEKTINPFLENVVCDGVCECVAAKVVVVY